MKVIEDKQDRYGNYPLWFYTDKISDIHEWLFKHYYGYKFAIVFDVTPDEYEPIEKPIPVYFLDEIAEEAASYGNYEIKKK